MPFLGTTGGGSVKQYGGLANLGYFIKNSLRFRASASAYLSRTPASTTNQKTWTWSGWVKRGQLSGSADFTLFGSVNPGVSQTTVSFSNDGFVVSSSGSGLAGINLKTSAVFRDPSAWYHIVVAVDTTQATDTNRVKIYINGVQSTSFSASTYPTQNTNCTLNVSGLEVNIARFNLVDSFQYFDGYLAEINFIDGQQLTSSSFGKTDAATGQWIPKKFASTYGTNGFYLKFADTSAATAAAIGKDSSPNGNNWTPNNISVTAGITYDAMIDVPTLTSATAANYCVLNPLVPTLAGASRPTISDGNLNISFGNAGFAVGGNMFVSSGQIYFEVSGTNAGGITNTISFNGFISDSGSYWGYQIFNGDISSDLGASAYDGTAYGSGAWPVIGIAVDLSTGKIWWRNDSGWFGSGNPATGANPAFTNVSGNITPYWNGGGGGYSGAHYFNFGQRPFAYTPPSGFKSLNTYNLP